MARSLPPLAQSCHHSYTEAMPTNEEILWLAGLLEGEANFHLNKNGAIAIKLSMTDEDVVQKAATIMDARMCASYQPKNPSYKRVFGCVLGNRPAYDLLKLLLPHMGVRRSARIQEMLEGWKQASYPYRVNRVTRKATCHPDRPLVGKGLCRTCYEYHRRTGHDRPADEDVNYAPRQRGVVARATCHPDRDLVGKGLCRTCYEYKRRTGRDRPANLDER
jgi:hypothetical protein